MKILWKYSERYVVKQGASDKSDRSRDPLTSYELDFWSDYVSIAKVKTQKVWSRSVDFCGDGEGKTWRGVDSTPPGLK